MKTQKMIKTINLLSVFLLFAGLNYQSSATAAAKNPCAAYSEACKSAGMTVETKDGKVIANQYCIQQILGKGPTKSNPNPQPIEIILNYVKTGKFVTAPAVDDATTAACAANIKVSSRRALAKKPKFNIIKLAKDVSSAKSSRPQSACAPYKKACEAAGFGLPPNGREGGAALALGSGAAQQAPPSNLKPGNRLIKDCLLVLLSGKPAKSLSGKVANPPTVDDNAKNACQSQIKKGDKQALFQSGIVTNPDDIRK